jgi:hypothetical protein
VERVVLNALLKINAALPPDSYARNTVERHLAASAIRFGIVFRRSRSTRRTAKNK